MEKQNISKMMDTVNRIHSFSTRLGTLGMIRSDYGQTDYFEDADVEAIQKASETIEEIYHRYFNKPYEEGVKHD